MITLKAAHIRHFKGIDDIIIQGCSAVNAFYGRNNSGKSTILHAIEMASLALKKRNWEQFQSKVEVKDMFHEAGPFEIELTYEDGRSLVVRQKEGGFQPSFEPTPDEEQKFTSVYIIPDPGLYRRRTITPKNAMAIFDSRQFSEVNGLEILYALKFYSDKSMRGFHKNDYKRIINHIQRFFPDIDKIISDRTEEDIATLTYSEYGRKLDIVYAGAGLKHFVDIFVKSTLSQASVVLIDEPETGLHPSLQRELLAHLLKLNEEKGTQFFLATHSPVFLSDTEKVSLFVMQNKKGKRSAEPVNVDSLYTFWGDLGIRPGDLLQNDIVVLVEGQDDIIFFERVLELYREKFHNIATAVVQYGGDAALGIIHNRIKVKNIVSGSSHRLWIRDRDTAPEESPETNSTKFKNALNKYNEKCHILKKREIEFYFPEDVHIEAQDGDRNKEKAVSEILNGVQCAKFEELASESQCAVVRGNNLRKLLQKHLRRDNLDKEIRQIVERILVPWCREIRGG